MQKASFDLFYQFLVFFNIAKSRQNSQDMHIFR